MEETEGLQKTPPPSKDEASKIALDLATVRLDTQRLRLVPLVDEKYAETIYSELTPDIVQYMTLSPHEDIESAKRYIAQKQQQIETKTGLPMAVLDKLTGDFIGVAALHHIDTRTPEIGLWMKASAQGRGYGQESVGALIDWAENYLNYDYLAYPVDVRNKGSRKLAKSLGGILSDKKIVEVVGKDTPQERTLHTVEYRFPPRAQKGKV